MTRFGGLVFLILAGCARVGTPAPSSPQDLSFPNGAWVSPSVPEGVLPPAAPSPSVGNLAGPPLPSVTLPAGTGNVRALWIVRTALAHPDSARGAVRRARAAGFNTLLVQVRGRGDAYYDSSWEPPPDGLGFAIGDYDPLAVVLEEAGRLGLSVHAWLNVHLVASSASPSTDPRHVIRSNPEFLAVPRALALDLFDRDPVDPEYLDALVRYTRGQATQLEGLYTNPSDAGVRNYLVAIVTDLLRKYPLEGIHFDYLRYPSAEFDYSRASLEHFRTWALQRMGEGALGAESRWEENPLAYVTAFPLLWEEFRIEQLSRTMEDLFRASKRVRPDLIISAAVSADAEEGRTLRFQEWEAWLDRGIVDVVAPMIYTGDQTVFVERLRRAALRDPRRIWAGVGVYQDTFQAAVGKALAARAIGVGGVAVFSYDWAVGPEGTSAAGGPYLPRFAGEVWGTDR